MESVSDGGGLVSLANPDPVDRETAIPQTAIPVGASTLAKVVNDDTGCLIPLGDLRFIASRLAPTVISVDQSIAEAIPFARDEASPFTTSPLSHHAP
jgi:hypothetical protein